MENERESRKYKLLLPIPIIILVLSIGILVNGYVQTGEWFLRSIELKGGTVITLNNPGEINLISLENSLTEFGIVSIKEIRGLSGSAITIEIGEEMDEDLLIEELSSIGIPTNDISIQAIGSSISSTFWVQAQYAVILAFVLMSIIVFIIFRSAIPSIAVILAAVSDIIITLAIMQVLGIELSFASLAAILTLIGYSVDTDVLLTTRVLKGFGTLKQRIRGAMKTGLTMSITTIGALTAIILISISQVLSQIAIVLLIGLTIDLINTWIQNTAILSWYAERKGI